MLVALLAAAFAGVGWLLADVRGATLFAFCSLLAASAAYAVRRPCAARDARRSPVRPRRGPSAPLDRRPGRRPARHIPAEAPAHRRQVSTCVRRRTRAAELDAASSARAAGRPVAGRARRRALARARARPRARRPHPDLRRASLGDAPRADAGRRVPLALPARRPCSRRLGVHASAPLVEAGARGGRGRGASRRSARPRGRADPPRACRASSWSSTPRRRRSRSTPSARSTTRSGSRACS